MVTAARLVLLGVVSLFVGCKPSDGPAVSAGTERDPYRHEISLFRLLANPEAYHGKIVHVTGVYFSGFEASFIAPSRELASASANCIWVDFAGSSRRKDREPQSAGEWATVIGTFDAKSHGHMSHFAATIHAIEGFQYRASWIEAEIKRSASSTAPTSGHATPSAHESRRP